MSEENKGRGAEIDLMRISFVDLLLYVAVAEGGRRCEAGIV